MQITIVNPITQNVHGKALKLQKITAAKRE
jgi:hypothetical protein